MQNAKCRNNEQGSCCSFLHFAFCILHFPVVSVSSVLSVVNSRSRFLVWVSMVAAIMMGVAGAAWADEDVGHGTAGGVDSKTVDETRKPDTDDPRHVLDNLSLVRDLKKLKEPPTQRGLWEELVDQPYFTPLQRGQKLLFHGQFAEAEKQFDTVLGGAQLDAATRQAAWEGRLESILRQGKTTDLERFTKALAAPPAGANDGTGATPAVGVVSLRALALMRAGKLVEARDLIRPMTTQKMAADKLPPAILLTTLNLYGQILEIQANYPAASAVYEQVGGLALLDLPEDPALQTQIAHALSRGGVLSTVGGNRQQEVLQRLTKIVEQIDRTYWPAHLEMARLLLGSHNAKDGGQEVAATLALNPNSFEAHELGVDFAIQSYNFDYAQREIDALKKLAQAPRVSALEGRLLLKQRLPEQAIAPLVAAVRGDPSAPEARGWLAGAYSLLCQNDKAQEQLKALSTPDAGAVGGHPVVLFEAAEILRDARQFTQAETLYLQSAQTAGWWSEPYAALAELYLETGQEIKAKQAYDKSFKIDPFNMRAFNQLTLLDYLNNTAQFRLLESAHFIVRYDKQDEILAKLAGEYLERIYPEVTGYFGVTQMPVKTQIEFFPSHEQFGVRTTGLPWIGTVGACTGNVIAMDVPRGGAKDLMGAFDWARVLRHEYTHAVTLALTNNRIPHWLTEAAACDQEQAPRDWDNCQLLCSNYRAGALFKLKDLNWGFIRPKRSIDRQLAYMQSQWIYEYLVATYGQPRMLEFMAAFRDGKTEPVALQSVYGKSQDQLDTEFLVWAGKQIESWGLPNEPLPQRAAAEKAVKDDPKNAEAKVALAWLVINGGNPREISSAITLLHEALALAPQHVRARELLGAILKTEAGILRDMAQRDPARIEQAKAKLGEARTLLEALVKDDPKRPVAWRTLGLMAMQDRRFEDAKQAFQELQQLRPLEDTSYQNLAGIYLLQQNVPAAIAQLMELQQHEQHDERIPRKLAELRRRQAQEATAAGKGGGDLREAESMAYKAVRINPYNAINHDLLAGILLEEKQPARAAEYYRHATELQPRIAQYWEGLAAALGQSGDTSSAAEAAKKAVELAPESAAKKWIRP